TREIFKSTIRKRRIYAITATKSALRRANLSCLIIPYIACRAGVEYQRCFRARESAARAAVANQNVASKAHCTARKKHSAIDERRRHSGAGDCVGTQWRIGVAPRFRREERQDERASQRQHG